MKKNARIITQFGATALSNGYVKGFLKGRIYTGKLKTFCVPGLNCYSCPGALGACPLGSLQNTIADSDYRFSLYVLGFLMIVGAVCGRFVCGWLCPFGLFQDLLYKIPFMRKLKKLPGEKYLGLLRYVVLAVFVILLPMFALDIAGQGAPWFCKYICPAGTFEAGIPLVLYDTTGFLRDSLGFIYTWKLAILAITVLASVIIFRPFCRYICPLGAIYGLFNRVSLLKYKLKPTACVRCGKCVSACKLGIDVLKNQNSIACIRCGECAAACPTGAIEIRFFGGKKKCVINSADGEIHK